MPKDNFRMRMQRQAAKAMAKATGLTLADKAPMQRAGGYAYQMAVNDDATEASINIYGDICEWAWEDWGEMSAALLSSKLAEMPATVSQINVHLNSYGGSVKEGIAIYNMLRSHSANVTTYCDGMACSIASVIFMAGDERVMSHASELMLHNAWSYAIGDAAELRKAADDLDMANDMSVSAYMSRITIDESKLRALMDAESWLTPDEALEAGFATRIEDYSAEEPVEEPEADEDPEPETDEDPEPETDDEDENEKKKEDAEESARKKWSALVRTLTAAQ